MKFPTSFLAISAISALPSVLGYVTGVDPSHPPHKSESGQTGYNDCGHVDSPSSMCQTLWINSWDDFCLFAPPNKNSLVGDTEEYEVAYCTKAGHGARLMPKGTLKSAHFVRTPHYWQITGVGDFTKTNIRRGDQGGELDPSGATGKGNPIGGLVFGNHTYGHPVQFSHWTEFISDNEFCIRACFDGPDSWRYCNHIYDVMGCFWNMPANYASNQFETCNGADDIPMGEYPQKNGKTSTWYQGVNPTPNAQPAAKSSQCTKFQTISPAAYPTSKPKTSTSSKFVALPPKPVVKKKTTVKKTTSKKVVPKKSH